MERLKQLGLPETFCFAPTPNLDSDQDGTWYPCYRSKEAQGHWKEYDVTTTYNPPDIQKVRMDPGTACFPKIVARRGKAMEQDPTTGIQRTFIRACRQSVTL